MKLSFSETGKNRRGAGVGWKPGVWFGTIWDVCYTAKQGVKQADISMESRRGVWTEDNNPGSPKHIQITHSNETEWHHAESECRQRKEQDLGLSPGPFQCLEIGKMRRDQRKMSSEERGESKGVMSSKPSEEKGSYHDWLGFSSRMQGWLNMQKSVNVIHRINKGQTTWPSQYTHWKHLTKSNTVDP